MATSVVCVEEQLEIPMDMRTLADFRRWALSDEFPQRGRIDFIAGRIEVDMSPEELFCHGTLKGEIHRELGNFIKDSDLGYLFIDRARVSSVEGNVSAEPDVVFLSYESVDEGRVRLVPKASGEPGRYVEIDGGPDLVVEIVSDGSVTKDTRRLPAGYYQAGVREFWLADARGEELVFQIHLRGDGAFEPAEVDADGYQYSPVLNRRFRLERRRDPRGIWQFDLLCRSKPV